MYELMIEALDLALYMNEWISLKNIVMSTML